MDLSNPGGLLWLAPRVVAYAVVAVVVAWLGHLLEPALTASFSRKYDAYPWVKGERGLLQFFSTVHECVFHAGGLFKSLYERVRGRKKQERGGTHEILLHLEGLTEKADAQIRQQAVLDPVPALEHGIHAAAPRGAHRRVRQAA